MKVSGGRTPVHSAWKLFAGLLLALSVQAPGMAAPQDDAAGRLAGAGLSVNLEPAGDVVLTWEASCLAGDTDYEVYEGVLGDPDTHEARVCTTAGALTWTLTPGPGGRYYLVVPRNATRPVHRLPGRRRTTPTIHWPPRPSSANGSGCPWMASPCLQAAMRRSSS